MKNKQTEWGTVAGMTALMGVFPLLITLGAAQFLLEHGGREWPDPVFAGLLTVLQMSLMAAGAWIFSAWFGD